MADFIPPTDGEKVPWLENYKTKLTTLGPTIGVSAGDITATNTSITNYITAFNSLVTKRAEAQALTTSVRADERSLFGTLRTQIGTFKRNSAYTEAIGEELQVIGTNGAFDPLTFKPKFKATVLPGGVLIDFIKGESSGVNIYCRLKGQTTWKFVARDTNSPYEDFSPLAQPGVPEVREYMLRGVKTDAEIGLMSDIVQVTFGG